MTTGRRLAAVMAVDVVGYSRLMGEDEAGTARAVREHRDAARPIVARLGGRIVKTMGDGLLLEFPSVVAAVECAIAIQKLMAERNDETPEAKRVVYRIGVNLGDVLIDGDDILGEGVNIAARLEGICEPGGVLISSAAYDHTRGKIDAAFIDLGEKTLKNIAQPVRAYSLQVGMPAVARPAIKAKPPEATKRSMPVPLIAGIVMLIVFFGVVGYFLTGSRRAPAVASSPPPAHLSIVVLPFTNLSNDPAQDYFADGITENLTTDLSRIRDSFVIARNTAFTFKGKTVDAKEIGKQLGVRYVLEGSVQRDQNRVRVNAQLIDAASGAHLWADHFEEDVADLFELQDQVVARLANALGYELVKAEAEAGAYSKNPDAIDLDMRAWAAINQWAQQKLTKDNLLAVRGLFDRALEIDPNDAAALAGEAHTYMNEYGLGWTNSKTDYDAKILGQADQALAIARDNMNAYGAKAIYLNVTSRSNDALRVANAGLAINPNSAYLHGIRSSAETYLRQFEEARSDIKEAMRLSPRDPRISTWYAYMADAELGLGNLDLTIEEFSRAIDGGYRIPYCYLELAAAHALKGEIDQAKVSLAEALRLNPKFSIKYLTVRKPVLQPAFDALRKAGLPEE